MRRIVLAVLVVAAVGYVAGPRAQSKRFITETDLFKFTWIADPQISPDGATVAFVRVVVNEKDNRYETSVFTVAASGGESPRRLTSGIHDTSPRWAPDGKRIAFVRSSASQSSASDNAGKTQPPQIFLLPLDGGEARPLTDVASGASGPVWSPDGKTIAFNSETSVDDVKKSDDPKPAAEHKSDVTVVTQAVYRANGNPTYVDRQHHSHIFTVDASEGPTGVGPGSDRGRTLLQKQITDGEFDERGLQWSPDGSTIYFTSTRVPEPWATETGDSLYRVPAAGGTITKIASIEGSIGNISVSPDGKRIAFVGALNGTPIRSYSQPDLWVTDATPDSTPKNLTASYDYDINGGIGGDQSAPRGGNRKPIVWSPDGRTLAVVSAEHGSSNLMIADVATGRINPLTEGKQDIVALSATRDGNKFAATFSTQTNIGDIFFLDYAPTPGQQHAPAPVQLTHVNADLFRDIQQSEPEELWYRSFDGKQIQSWILKPPDFDPSKKYPFILEIHGGPHGAYGNVYTHEFQWMAAKGYVVLFTNPRGSTTYGQDFGNIIQYHYPGDDYKDLMAGVDEVLKKGYVDPNRLGVTGGSGGGLLTNWTITQTQRFKAAVAQRDIADWYGFWFTADFTLFQPTWFKKAPWEDPQDFAARSPITHVANVTTPLMLVNGDADYRTPPADGGEMMFRALKYRKIPTVMVRFPRETHELSRSGEPWHRVERLQHIVGWMDEWLRGEKHTAYSTGELGK
ncbi:MAG: S9 family peptidase [Acidobacteriia bacterium]|nr:S9 family peptidase [Terriglobia bacterium]